MKGFLSRKQFEIRGIFRISSNSQHEETIFKGNLLEKTIQQEIVLLGKHGISIKLLNKEFSIKSQSS